MKMYKKKYIYFILFFLLVGFVFGQNQVKVKITGKGLVIGTPSNLDLGTVSTGTVVVKNFSGYFWIEDLRGYSTGHYTTIQCDGIYGPNNYVITGIELLGPTVVKIAGGDNDTKTFSSLTSWTDITKPSLYLYRNNIVGRNDLVNRYGNEPSIRITVPNDVPVGSYKGKITYTLYDYGVNITN